jgi:hypothetical protein
MEILEKFRTNAASLHAMTGLKPQEFDQILETLGKIWQEKVNEKYKRPGRNPKLTLAAMLFLTLTYYHCSVTYGFLAELTDVNSATICRIVRRIETLLAGSGCLKKTRRVAKEVLQTTVACAAKSSA